MAANYVIVSQVPKTRAKPGGLFEQVMQITFTTKPSDQVGTVDVPIRMYAADEVDKIVAQQAATIEAVQHL
jgi:hypothetical protein